MHPQETTKKKKKSPDSYVYLCNFHSNSSIRTAFKTIHMFNKYHTVVITGPACLKQRSHYNLEQQACQINYIKCNDIISLAPMATHCQQAKTRGADMSGSQFLSVLFRLTNGAVTPSTLTRYIFQIEWEFLNISNKLTCQLIY